MSEFNPEELKYIMNDCQNYNQENNLYNLERNIAQAKQRFATRDAISVQQSGFNSEFLAVKSIGKIDIIPLADIFWLHASSNYIEIHLEKKTLLHRESLINLELKLPYEIFVRVHRSSIVNLTKVLHINSELGRFNNVTLTNGNEVKLSKAYKSNLFKILGVEA